MSAAKMVADSTQSEFDAAMDGKKRKKRLKKAGKKISLPEDEDSDLDLKKDLKPITAYVKDRPLMIQKMFHAIRGASLQRALPDLLKSIPLDEMKLLCLEQLEVMSKKRIRRILAGEDSANISSSGTEDDTSDEEAQPPDDLSQQPATGEVQVEGHPADSTSVHQEIAARNIQRTHTEEPSALVKVKLEPPDSGDDGEGENEDEDQPETYTSGSEDGELVTKEEQRDDSHDTLVKQEPMSDGDEDMEDDDEMASMEDIARDLGASMQATGSEDGVLPSIMMDQMELLELEMRARAIKAMLSSHDDDGTVVDDNNDDTDDDDDVGSVKNETDVDGMNSNDDDGNTAYT